MSVNYPPPGKPWHFAVFCDTCHRCIDRDRLYMVTDECWSRAGLTAEQDACLCCLDKLLPGGLRRSDFTEAPINGEILFLMDIATRETQTCAKLQE